MRRDEVSAGIFGLEIKVVEVTSIVEESGTWSS